jgi:hypothetical protein
VLITPLFVRPARYSARTRLDETRLTTFRDTFYICHFLQPAVHSDGARSLHFLDLGTLFCTRSLRHRSKGPNETHCIHGMRSRETTTDRWRNQNSPDRHEPFSSLVTISLLQNLLFVEGESSPRRIGKSLEFLICGSLPLYDTHGRRFLRSMGWDLGFPCHNHTWEESILTFLF